MRAGVTIVDPATTWIDVDVQLEPDAIAATRARILRGRDVGRRGRRGRARTRTLIDTEVGAGAHGHPHARPSRRHRRRARTSGRSPTCGPAPTSARGAKVGRLRRDQERQRRRRREGAAPVLRRRRRDRRGHQHRRRHGLRQLRRRRQAPHRRRRATCGSAATPCSSRRSRSATAPTPRPGSVITDDVPAGRAGGRPGPAAQRRGLGGSGRRPGSAVGEAAAEARTTSAGRRADRSGRLTADGARASGSSDRHVQTPREAADAHLRAAPTRSWPTQVADGARHRRSSPTQAYDFANGEIFVRFEESVRGCDAFVLQSHTEPDQQVDHGAADHGRRAQAGLGQADHRDRRRSTATPGRTRSTAAASRSRPG